MSTDSKKLQYLDHYGFRQAPFRLSPDPSFFYPSPTHLSAEKILAHAIAGGEGFMVLSGKAGLGKTLLLRRLLEKIDQHKIPILILSPGVDQHGLLQLLLGEMGVKYDPDSSLAVLLQTFQNLILETALEQKEFFIIVDEAQNMPIATLEQLRMLSNLETGKRKLMQILLVGQSELDEILTNPRLGQLVQRIVVYEKLKPLSCQEIGQYVRYRLGKAGRSDIYLSRGGCALIARKSKGIPRIINRIMDRALLLASVKPPVKLTREHINTALTTMQDLCPKPLFRSRKTAIATAISLILLAVFYYLFQATTVFSRVTPC